jgi:hypothetical protein
MIHSYDAPPLAAAGLKVARRCASGAARAAHAITHFRSTRTVAGVDRIEFGWQSGRAFLCTGNHGRGAYDHETLHTMDYLA